MGFPSDVDFPQLAIAANPRLMLGILRANLKPLGGKTLRVEGCRPFRFRCRQSTARCVLQYSVRITDPITNRTWDQWVTAVLYSDPGEAELLWHEMRSMNPARQIPEGWETFEPVGYVPSLRMLLEVFPFDRRLPNLLPALGSVMSVLDPRLLGRLGTGRWDIEQRAIEPTRYRTELGAALRYSVQARDCSTGRRETIRCYLKVYRDDRGAETWRLLQALGEQDGHAQRPYSIMKPIEYLSDLRILALEEAPGRPLIHLLLQDDRVPEALRLVARAVAHFNQDELPIRRHESLADQSDHVRLSSNLVQWASPESGKAARAITAAVEQDLVDVPPAPIHGDLKADHIFVSPDHVTFIDLDSAAQGDPVRDPAHLFAYLAGGVGLDSLPITRAREVAKTFVREYFHQVPSSWRQRFPTHCAGALLEVASGIFRRQEPHWRDKVQEVVAFAQHILSNGLR